MSVREDTKKLSDTELERLAAEEILKDTQKAASRAETFGATAWLKPSLPKPNKVFLARAIGGSIMQNAYLGADRSSASSTPTRSRDKNERPIIRDEKRTADPKRNRDDGKHTKESRSDSRNSSTRQREDDSKRAKRYSPHDKRSRRSRSRSSDRNRRK